MAKDMLSTIAGMVELRKFNRLCNKPGCSRVPVKEHLLVEVDRSSLKTKDLVSLYFCSRHEKDVEPMLKELNRQCTGNMAIGKRSFDIGYVTY